MKYFFVTGVSRGIGKALAERILAEENHFVIGISRKSEIQHPGYIHHYIDLSDVEDTAGFVFEDLPDASSISLINNAGTLGEVKRLGRLSIPDMVRTYNLNLIAPSILMNNFIKAYQDLDIPRVIINITSGAAQHPYDGWSAYCSTKAGIDMLTRVGSVEQQLQSNPITVLAVAPGVVETAMQAEIRGADENEFSTRQRFIDLHKDAQLYLPSDVADELLAILKNPAKTGGIVSRIKI